MRIYAALATGLILFGGGTAARAQPWPYPELSHQQGVLEAEQRQARDRMIALENDVNARAAQAQGERAIGQVREQAAPVWVPRIIPQDPDAETDPTPTLGPYSFPKIPSEWLARSNARVLAITGQWR